MSREASLVLVKPDAICRGLTGQVVDRLGVSRASMVGAKVVRVTRALAEEHYKPLRGKPFFEELIRYVCGELHGVDHVLALAYVGDHAIRALRECAGATNPEQAAPTSIRGALGRITTGGVMENLVHASSDAREAEREIKLWFRPEELLVPVYPTAPGTRGARGVLVWA